uniref:Uncharacterized protein n=1 Tax=Strigamia maritima TaxID=126957 RepID=T1IJ21_STRMM
MAPQLRQICCQVVMATNESPSCPRHNPNISHNMEMRHEVQSTEPHYNNKGPLNINYKYLEFTQEGSLISSMVVSATVDEMGHFREQAATEMSIEAINRGAPNPPKKRKIMSRETSLITIMSNRRGMDTLAFLRAIASSFK